MQPGPASRVNCRDFSQYCSRSDLSSPCTHSEQADPRHGRAKGSGQPRKTVYQGRCWHGEVPGFAFVAAVEAAGAGEPGHGAFDRPPVSSESLRGLDALAGGSGPSCDAAGSPTSSSPPQTTSSSARRGFRRIQYRSDLIDGCLAEAGLTIRLA